MAKRIYARGNRLWCRLKNEAGEWTSKPTPFNVGDERKAQRYREAAQKLIDDRRASGENAAPDTVRAFATKVWAPRRRERGVGAADEDLARLERYVLPAIGHMKLPDVRRKQIRDVVHALRSRTGDDALAPRTIIGIAGAVHNLFECALDDELIAVNPAAKLRRDLPKKLDADPEWRSRATFTVREVERLISDSSIPVERRVQYALKAIAGVRHGEAAGLLWRHIDHDAEPLARITVCQSWDSRRQRIKSTKTGETRSVPLHPTLAKILATWKLTHWPRIYGRKPTDDDYVVPTRTMQPVNASDAVHAFKDDLLALELRVDAGERRDRGGHDLRGWYQTRLIEDGADSLIVRRTTHAPPKDVNAGYERFSWQTICREVSKLKVSILDGEVLTLATGFATRERNARARWKKLATPTGFEPVLPA